MRSIEIPTKLRHGDTISLMIIKEKILHEIASPSFDFAKNAPLRTARNDGVSFYRNF